MAIVRHLNCGTLHAPPNPAASCHCLLVEGRDGWTLIDTGIGLLDVANPIHRVGRAAIDAAGFCFREEETALRQIERLGLRAGDVTHIVLTHGDPDHAGGLADFPDAVVHISDEEHEQIAMGHWRYRLEQFEHGPKWRTYPRSSAPWFGVEARPLAIGADEDIRLVPLFGHTLGHCGVAVRQGSRWLLHVGDAYYLRVELTTDDHPVSLLAARRAENDDRRIESLRHLRRLAREHPDEIEMFGYHDFSEFPDFRP